MRTAAFDVPIAAADSRGRTSGVHRCDGMNERPVIIGGDPTKQRTSIVQGRVHSEDHMPADWTVFDSYQVYAVCGRCGAHDWGEEFYDKDGREACRADFEAKYPGARVSSIWDEVVTLYECEKHPDVLYSEENLHGTGHHGGPDIDLAPAVYVCDGPMRETKGI